MSSSSQIMTKGICYIQGNQMTYETSVTVKITSGAKDAMTVGRQWAGVYPGAGMTTITFKSAVPSAAFEFDPTGFIVNLNQASVSIFFGGKNLTLDGFIMEETFSHSVDGEGTIDFEFHGPAVEMNDA